MDRLQTWPRLACISHLSSIYPPDYYLRLCQLETFPDYYEHQIALDIKRKLSLQSDEIDTEMKKKTLSRVLNCYVKRNSNVGYCQGFNYITNYMYEKGFSEE